VTRIGPRLETIGLERGLTIVRAAVLQRYNCREIRSKSDLTGTKNARTESTDGPRNGASA